jgi:phosphoglycolate phosphatase-like HAD superfamily hydrolase
MFISFPLDSARGPETMVCSNPKGSILMLRGNQRSVLGVLLDVDGTLVDSNDAHARAWVEALQEHDVDISFGQVRRLIGMGGDKLLPLAAGIQDESAEGQRITQRRGEIFMMKYLPILRAFPGTKELLRRMHTDGLRLAVASSAKSDELNALLKICGADDVIETKTSSDDAERSKPDPDIVRAALKDLGLGPAKVMMLGDTPYDIEAAARTEVRTIALRCGGWGELDLSGAVAIYLDPAELLRNYESSPLAR